MFRELVHAMRGLVRRGVVRAVNDALGTQLVDVAIADGHSRSAVEVLQPFGFASCPPGGGLAVLLAVGGDQGDLVALPLAAPGARFGGLKPGESALYGADGSRVHVKQDGTVEVLGAKAVEIATPGGDGGARVRLTKEGVIEISAAQDIQVTTPAGMMQLGADGLTAQLGDSAVTLTEDRASLKQGSTVMSASAAAARLKTGGHFIAATPGGVVASAAPTIGADPDPDPS